MIGVGTKEIALSTHNAYFMNEYKQRPWGSWEVLSVGQQYIVKRVEICPGHRLSLQYHHHRAEHWIVVSGKGEVEIDGNIYLAEPFSHFCITQLQMHRIRNTGDTPLVFIETQCGEYLNEDDIVRIEDDYERHST